MSIEEKPLVCVVDDEEINRAILAEILKNDFQVCQAGDGESALTLIKEQQPQIVLLDIVMPGIDGLETCRRLKAYEQTTEIPVIFVTSESDLGNESAGLDAGAEDYITKPVSPSVVLARVGRILEVTMYISFLESLIRQKDEDLGLFKEQARLLLEQRQ